MSREAQRDSTLESLARLQLEALRAPVVSPANDEAIGGAYVDVVADLARRHGFEPLGVGSSRFAVSLDGETVAKLAWDVRGLDFNLGEAATWLASPPRIRQCLVPLKRISKEGVLLVEAVAPIAPAVVDSAGSDTPQWHAATAAAALSWHERINELRAAMSVGPNELSELRMQNYGETPRGELVALDFDLYQPTRKKEAFRWLYRATEGGPVWLDSSARRRFERQLRKRGGRAELAAVHYDLLTLADRAGWSVTHDELMAHHRAAEALQGSGAPLCTGAAG